mgnify:FL=1|tara:strand:- start:290 stop:1159 length:870 start_codon:yes stop_codon:yes gene_type:complete
MGNDLRSIDDCYTKFGLTNTSKSENSLPDDVRFFQRIVLTPKERASLPSNASFFMGTLIHEAAQNILVNNTKLDLFLKILNKKVKEYNVSEKDKIKANLIATQAPKIIQNIVDEVLKLESKSSFKAETEYTIWDDRIGTYFRCFLDLEGSKYFYDFKNLFGSIRETKKGWSISKRKIDDKIFTKDIMSIALYKKAVPHLKPCLIYATEDEATAFHEDNTPELRPDNLIKYYDELIVYQKIWENKLRYADGDIKKLASIIKTDFSEIRKDAFWWKGVDSQYIERLIKLYV